MLCPSILVRVFGLQVSTCKVTDRPFAGQRQPYVEVATGDALLESCKHLSSEALNALLNKLQ